MPDKSQLPTFLPNVVYEIDLSKIIVSPFKPQARRRLNFKPDELDSLGDSIKTHTLAQPILLRINKAGKLEIVFGERRFLGSKRAGLKTILAFVRDLDDKTVLELQYEENHRQQQNDPLDDAFFFQYLIDTENYTPESLADRFNRQKRDITDALKLNDLIEPASAELSSGSLPLKHAYYLAKFPADTQRLIVELQLAYKYYNRDEKAVSFEIFKEEVENAIVRRLINAPFPLDDPRLHVRGLLCHDCPDNSAFATHLFPEFAGEARCLNKACFQIKTNTHLRLQREKIAAQIPNPTFMPAEEIIKEVPLVTERKYTNDRAVFAEKVLVNQELLDEPECAFCVAVVAVEGAKQGKDVFICKNDDCPVHHPKPISGELDDDELTEMESDFDERVAMRVRLKVMKHALEWFDDRKTFWQFDDLIKNLIVEFLLNVSPDYHKDILWLVSDWKNAPRKLNDREQLQAFVSELDKAKQSQILFLLSVISTEDLEVLSIARGYTNIHFPTLDAEARLELAPPEFKIVANLYLQQIKNGQNVPVPTFWQKNDFGDVAMVTTEEQ